MLTESQTKNVLGVLVLTLLCTIASAQPGDRSTLSKTTAPSFTDVTAAAGIITELTGTHGVSVADIDNDNLVDIYINSQEDYWIPAGNYIGNFLFKNNGNGTFVRYDSLAGIQDIPSSGHTPVFFDMDRDGDFDLAVGHSRDQLPTRALFRNENNGTFTQIDSVAGFESTGDIGTRAIVVGDVNGDGFMDIHFAAFSGFDIEGYHGDGYGNFTRDLNLNDRARAVQGMIAGDLDGDGDLDVLMGNFDTDDGIGYFRNDGYGGFSRAMGTGLPETGFYATANLSDVNADGRLDVLLISEETGFADLYLNQDTTFVLHQQFGLVTDCDGGCGGNNGAFGDFDNDGDFDLFIPTGIKNLWMNDGTGSFYGVPNASSGLTFALEDARFPSLLDYDIDGDLDILVAFHDAPARLYSNGINNNRYVRVRATGPRGDKGGFGTKISIYESGHLGNPAQLIAYQEVMASGGYCVQHEPVAHFGVGTRPGVDMRVEFIDGTVSDFSGVQAGKVFGVWSDVIQSVASEIPQNYGLEQNYPNPFNPETAIHFQLPATQEVQIKIFDLLGREVITLIDGVRHAGEHRVTWNGRDRYGTSATTGIYLYELRSATFTQIRKMTLIR